MKRSLLCLACVFVIARSALADALHGDVSVSAAEFTEIAFTGNRDLFPGETVNITVAGRFCRHHVHREWETGWWLWKKHHVDDHHEYADTSTHPLKICYFGPGGRPQIDVKDRGEIRIEENVLADFRTPTRLQGYITGEDITRNSTCRDTNVRVTMTVDSSGRLGLLKEKMKEKRFELWEIEDENFINSRLKAQYSTQLADVLTAHYKQYYARNPADGEKLLRLALRLAPQSDGPALALASLYADFGDPRAVAAIEQSLQKAREMVARSPSLDSKNNLGAACMIAAKYYTNRHDGVDGQDKGRAFAFLAQAINLFEECKSLDKAADARILRASLLARAGTITAQERSIEELKKAISMVGVALKAPPVSFLSERHLLLIESQKAAFMRVPLNANWWMPGDNLMTERGAEIISSDSSGRTLLFQRNTDQLELLSLDGTKRTLGATALPALSALNTKAAVFVSAKKGTRPIVKELIVWSGTEPIAVNADASVAESEVLSIAIAAGSNEFAALVRPPESAEQRLLFFKLTGEFERSVACPVSSALSFSLSTDSAYAFFSLNNHRIQAVRFEPDKCELLGLQECRWENCIWFRGEPSVITPNGAIKSLIKPEAETVATLASDGEAVTVATVAGEDATAYYVVTKGLTSDTGKLYKLYKLEGTLQPVPCSDAVLAKALEGRARIVGSQDGLSLVSGGSVRRYSVFDRENFAITSEWVGVLLEDASDTEKVIYTLSKKSNSFYECIGGCILRHDFSGQKGEITQQITNGALRSVTFTTEGGVWAFGMSSGNGNNTVVRGCALEDSNGNPSKPLLWKQSPSVQSIDGAAVNLVSTGKAIWIGPIKSGDNGSFVQLAAQNGRIVRTSEINIGALSLGSQTSLFAGCRDCVLYSQHMSTGGELALQQVQRGGPASTIWKGAANEVGYSCASEDRQIWIAKLIGEGLSNNPLLIEMRNGQAPLVHSIGVQTPASATAFRISRDGAVIGAIEKGKETGFLVHLLRTNGLQVVGTLDGDGIVDVDDRGVALSRSGVYYYQPAVR